MAGHRPVEQPPRRRRIQRDDGGGGFRSSQAYPSLAGDGLLEQSPRGRSYSFGVGAVLLRFRQNALVGRRKDVLNEDILQAFKRFSLPVLGSGHDFHPSGKALSMRRRIRRRFDAKAILLNSVNARSTSPS